MLRNAKNALWIMTLIGSMLTTTHLAGGAFSCPRRPHCKARDDIKAAYNTYCVQLKPVKDTEDLQVPDVVLVGGLCDSKERFGEFIKHVEQRVMVGARPIVVKVIPLGAIFGRLEQRELNVGLELDTLKAEMQHIIDQKQAQQENKKVKIVAYSFGATMFCKMVEKYRIDRMFAENDIQVILVAMCLGFANSRSNAWYYMERKLFDWFGIFKYSGAMDYRLAQWRRLPKDKQIAILSLVTPYGIIEECSRISKETYEMLLNGNRIESIRGIGIFEEDGTVDNWKIGECAIACKFLNLKKLPGDHTSHFRNPEPLAQWIQELLGITISDTDLQKIIEGVVNQTRDTEIQIRQRLPYSPSSQAK